MAKDKAKSRRRQRRDRDPLTDSADIPTYKEREWQKRHVAEQKQSSWCTVHYPDEGKYIGHINELGERHGEGLLQGDKGMSYEGNWECGLMSGSGVKMFPSGDRYEGSHKNGQRCGWGYYLWNCGDKYTGMWEKSVMEGEGCFVWACGDMYTGMWKQGVISGQGHKICADGSSVKGKFRNGEPHGWCVQTVVAGDVYTGNLKAGIRHGYGQYQWVNGDVYTGMWVNGRMQGEGDLVVTPRKGRGAGNEDAVLAYRGEFHEGARHGYGEGTFGSGNRYSGHWQMDEPHGWGTMVFPNGDVGEGEFNKGVLAANGLMVFRSHDHTAHGPNHDGNPQPNLSEFSINAMNSAVSAASAGLFEDSSLWLLSCMSPITPLPLLQDMAFLPSPRLNRPLSSQVYSTFSSSSGLTIANEFDSDPEPMYAVPPSQLPLRDDLYRGTWQNNFPHGKGAMDYSSGNVFLGQFCCGRRDGAGILFRKKVKSVREFHAEASDEDFGELLEGLHEGHRVSAGEYLALFISHGAFGGAHNNEGSSGVGGLQDSPLSDVRVPEEDTRRTSSSVVLRNMKYLSQIRECLQWDASVTATAASFPYDIIRGVWREDRLVSLQP
mmetsp:Transcript_23444/g.39767  ORF Transcript_23444/g.39767 Transcript_23444/m.39767 type:complete len:604 (-) Transcript_23444:259-2070(-)